MSKSRNQSIQQITLAQLKANFETINQDRETLSEFKLPIIEAIGKYIAEIEKRFLATEQSRLQIIQNILDKVHEHDIFFLPYVISQTITVTNINSSLRDSIGKIAYIQNVRYLSSVLELACLSTCIFSLFNGSAAVDLLLIASIFTIHSLQNSHQNILLRHEHLRDGSAEIDHNIRSARISDLLSIPGNYRFDGLASASNSIVTNVTHLLQANWIFFRRQQEGQPQQVPQAAPALPAPVPAKPNN